MSMNYCVIHAYLFLLRIVVLFSLSLFFYDGHKNIIISIVRTIDNRGERSAMTMIFEKLSVAMHRAIVSLIEDF